MYTSKMTSDQWLQQISMVANQIVNASETGRILYEKFNAMTFGMTDAQILAMSKFATWTQADLTAVKAALSSLMNMSDALHNNPFAQGDRYAYFAAFLLG